jgi:magnesium chelatase family protein
MNPCPCGHAGSTLHACQCSLAQIKKYVGKISGPLLDRIDMQVEVSYVPQELLTAHADKQRIEKSDAVSVRVMQARDHQLKRQGRPNALLTVTELEKVSDMDEKAEGVLNEVMKRFNFSARVYHRLIKLARTIADLEQGQAILVKHVSEALQYRFLDRLKSRC